MRNEFAARESSQDRATSMMWIDWGRHLRTHTLSRRLAVDLLEICIPGGRIRRYLKSSFRTLAAIHGRRPAIVIASNPSIVLGYLLLLLRLVYRFRLVSDAHYLGVSTIPPRRLMQWLLDFHNAHVDLVIVTNEGHARFLRSIGAHPYVCPDPLPRLPAATATTVTVPPKSAFLICSFDVDEPWRAAFTAFEELQQQEYKLLVCGNYKKAGIEPSQFPWVSFLGFVPDSEYYEYLRSCSVVLDLTTVDNCLVCGAYEALAASKPLVVSDTNALREYFGEAVILTDNEPAAIRENVGRAYREREVLSLKAARWSAQNELHMAERITELWQRLVSLNGQRRSPVHVSQTI